jgi:hypothetical protein
MRNEKSQVRTRMMVVAEHGLLAVAEPVAVLGGWVGLVD